MALQYLSLLVGIYSTVNERALLLRGRRRVKKRKNLFLEKLVYIRDDDDELVLVVGIFIVDDQEQAIMSAVIDIFEFFFHIFHR